MKRIKIIKSWDYAEDYGEVESVVNNYLSEGWEIFSSMLDKEDSLVIILTIELKERSLVDDALRFPTQSEIDRNEQRLAVMQTIFKD